MDKGRSMPYSRHKYIYKLSPSIHLGGLFYLHSYWSRLLQFDSALCTNLKLIKMESIRNLEMYKVIVQKYGKDFMKSYEYLSSTSVDRLKIKIVCNKLMN